jgi:putative membrane protein
MRCLLRWAVGVVAILATVQVMKALPPQYGLQWRSVWGMVVFVPVFALVNAVVGLILRLLSLPITCVTLGLFGFVINATVFYVAGSATGARAMSGEHIGFVTALLASVIYTVVSAPLAAAVKERR